MSCDEESAALADPRLRRRKTQDEAALDEDFLLPSSHKRLAAHTPGDGEAWQPDAWTLMPGQPDESLELGLEFLI